MLSELARGIIEVVFHFVFEVVCYWIGRIVVPLVSLGRWNPLGDDTPRRAPAGVRRLRRGREVRLSVEATQFVGVAALVLVIGGTVLIWFVNRG